MVQIKLVLKKLMLMSLALVLVLAQLVSLPVFTKKTSATVQSYTYFCHRARAANNPYQLVPFSQTYAEIDGNGDNDHSLHNEPAVTTLEQAKQVKKSGQFWGDIIPPVAEIGFLGLNWNATTQVIYANGCAYPDVPDPEPEMGNLRVSKQVDRDGNGVYAPVNTFTDDFMWGVAPGAISNAMGSTITLEAGNYKVYENQVGEYKYKGWYIRGDTRYSCSNPRGTSLPNAKVEQNKTTSIVLCNQNREKEEERGMGRIHVTKKTLPSTNTRSFSIFADKFARDGHIYEGQTRSITNGQTVTYKVDYGTYKVVEHQRDGWTQNDKDCAYLRVSKRNPVVYCEIVNTEHARVRGIKFHDANNDRRYNRDTEEKLAGWTIYADLNKNRRLDVNEPRAVTGEDGRYNLDLGPKTGTYSICEVWQKGWQQTYPAFYGCHQVSVKPGDVMGNRDFGNRKHETKPRVYNSITVNKDAKPNHAQDFRFTLEKQVKKECPSVNIMLPVEIECHSSEWDKHFYLDDDSDSTLSNTKKFSKLKPGRYVVTENQVNGWDLKSIHCTGVEYTKTENQVSFYVKKDTKANCTFTNKKNEPVVPTTPTTPSSPTGVLGSSVTAAPAVTFASTPQVLSYAPSVLANTGETYSNRSALFGLSIILTTIATALTKRSNKLALSGSLR